MKYKFIGYIKSVFRELILKRITKREDSPELSDSGEFDDTDTDKSLPSSKLAKIHGFEPTPFTSLKKTALKLGT